MEWIPEVDKLILEMLSNRTPPTCIQANILAMAKIMFPNYQVVKELPSTNHIRRMRTAELIISKTLAAYRIGNAPTIKQFYSDGTSKRQTEIVNVVVDIIQSDNTT